MNGICRVNVVTLKQKLLGTTKTGWHGVHIIISFKDVKGLKEIYKVATFNGTFYL